MTEPFQQAITFQPLLPWPLLALIALAALFALALSLRLRLAGAWFRGMAALMILTALAGPALRDEQRAPLKDVVLLVDDDSGSDRIGDRVGQRRQALAAIRADLAAMGNVEVRDLTLTDDADRSTLLHEALALALARVPQGRLAGTIIVSDGRFADRGPPPSSDAPVTLALTGTRSDWDRALTLTRVPGFGLLGRDTAIGVRIDEQGQMPAALRGKPVDLTVSVDGGPDQTFRAVPVNSAQTITLRLAHPGANVLRLAIQPSAGEATPENNSAILTINGVRDRLRVLLVSGEPYAGERTWRNLLKSDASVDLVHFTILRPPEKEDGVPDSELALIPFPTDELFERKLANFDLIIFDRFGQRGLLDVRYLANIADYVRKGGALLVAAGPEYETAESLYFSDLADVLPAQPTTRVIEGPFLPTISQTGARHPVTEALGQAPGAAPLASNGQANWGRWLRYSELASPRGSVVLQTPDGAPLLVLDRQGSGRVALLASDQSWLWARGFEGGGPQQELLRRLAHWLMKEPDLEEEALQATVQGARVTFTRRTLGEGPRTVTVTGPAGATATVPLREVRPGLFAGGWTAPAQGFYQAREGGQQRVFAVGPGAPREFADVTPSAKGAAPLIAATGGGVYWLQDGAPDVRAVRAGRPVVGRDWIGIVPRGAYQTTGLRLAPLLPDWALFLLAATFLLCGWLAEGRRPRR